MNESPELYKIIGKRLKQRREEAEMTQGELAEAIGLLRTSIANIEAGRQKAPVHVLYLLCNELGIELASVIPTSAEVEGSAGDDIVSVMREEFPVAGGCLQRMLERLDQKGGRAGLPR